MPDYFPPWPEGGSPWPETQRSSTDGHAPDFPSSAGDRERGRFRPSHYRPKLTTVAVTNDDGTAIGVVGTSDAQSSSYSIHLMEETNDLLRALILGLSILTDTDLIEEGLDLGNS